MRRQTATVFVKDSFCGLKINICKKKNPFGKEKKYKIRGKHSHVVLIDCWYSEICGISENILQIYFLC